MVAITKHDISDALIEFYGKIIEPQFAKLHKKLEEHDEKFGDLSSHFGKIYNRLERLETEYFTITSGLKRIETLLEGIQGKFDNESAVRERLEKEVAGLKQRVSVLQNQIEEMETRIKAIPRQ
jgi:chromosome segregation ATPase